MQKQFLGTISALLGIVMLAGAQTPGQTARGTTLEAVGVSRESRGAINIEITTRDDTAPWVETLADPARIVVDLPNTVLATRLGPIPIRTNGVKGIRIGTDAAKTTRVVVDLATLCRYELVRGSGHQLILKLDPTSPAPALTAEAGASSSQSPPSHSAPEKVVTASATNGEPAAAALPANAGVQPSAKSQPSSTAGHWQQNITQPAPATDPSAGSAASTVTPAGSPVSNTNTASQPSSGEVATARTPEASSTVASAQPNPQPATASSPAANASAASGGPATETVGAPRQTGVGGHVGAVFPLVTHAGGANTSIADSFAVGFPMGVTFHGQGRMAFDLEFVPLIQNSPRQVNLTVHPGLVWGVGHRFSVGMRAAFDVNSAQFGFTPLVNKSWPIEGSFFKAYFVEADLPVRFNRPTGGLPTNPVTFAMHFGLGF